MNINDRPVSVSEVIEIIEWYERLKGVIDADAFVADSKWCGLETAEQVLFALEHQPSIDIVRCKECKWKDTFKCWMRNTQVPRYPNADDFCSYGERKESE